MMTFYTNDRTPFLSLFTGLTLALVLVTTSSFSHSKLADPAPRNSSDPETQNRINGGGINFDPPCGPAELIPAAATTAIWNAGSDQNIVIQHMVNHGVENLQFLVSYDEGTTFVELLPPSQDQGGSTSYMTGGLPAPAGTGVRSIRVQAPLNQSGKVILRYTDGTYFSCADIEISGTTDKLIFENSFESE